MAVTFGCPCFLTLLASPDQDAAGGFGLVGKVLLVLSRFKALSHLLFLSSHAREKRNHPTGYQIWPKAKYEANVI